MRVPDAMCDLAPHSPHLEKHLESNPRNLSESIRSIAATGDKSALSNLPPVWMHDRPEAWAQKLYGGVRASHIENASYKAGVGSMDQMSSSILLGAAIIDLSHGPHVVVIEDAPENGLNAIVFDTPMADLESRLYAHCNGPTPLEVKWKGPELAAAHLSLRESTGVHIRSGGLACTPGFLLCNDKKSYHLVRSGPMPFLHMRSPSTSREVELIENALHAYLIEAREPHNGRKAHSNDSTAQVPDVRATLLARVETTARMTTTFLRRTNPGTSRVSDPKFSSLALVASKYARLPVVVFIATRLIGAPVEPYPDYLAKLEEAVKAVGSEEIKSVTTDYLHTQPETLARLTSFSSSCVNVRFIGRSGISQSYVLASAIFAALDVGLAVKELSSLSTIGMMWNMAKRVDEVCAMLCMELGPSNVIKSLRLINSCIDYELDIDSAARLIECPWVVMVAHCTPTNEATGFFTIETDGIERDMLRVCDSVRTTYGLEAQRHVRPPQTSNADFQELDKRIKALEVMLEKRTAPVSAPAPASLPAPIVTYTSPELERLKSAHKKWVGILGKRPR